MTEIFKGWRLFVLLAIAVLPLCFGLFVLTIDAATLNLKSAVNEVEITNTFTVELAVNAQGQAINNAEGILFFPTNLVEVKSINLGGSIFSLWVEQPTFSNRDGTISFNGGIPTPGYNGANGRILTATFQAKSLGTANLNLKDGAIRLNDGLGTNAFNGSNALSIKIVSPTPAVEEKKPPIEIRPVTTPKEKPPVSVMVPEITNIPDQLLEGSSLSFTVKGMSNGQVLVYISKGRNNPEITQVATGENGEFDVVYKVPVETGYYRVWARNILPGEVLSLSSDIAYVEVVKDSQICNIKKYENLIIVLSSLLLILMVLLILVILYLLKYRDDDDDDDNVKISVTSTSLNNKNSLTSPQN